MHHGTEIDMIDINEAEKPEQVPYNVYPLGIMIDKNMLLVGVPASDCACQDDIDAHVKKAQAWLREMWERTHGMDERLKAIGAMRLPGQEGSPESHAAESPAPSSPQLSESSAGDAPDVGQASTPA